VQIIEAIARQAYLIGRKSIESLQPTLTSERRAILKANRMGQIFGHLSSFPGQTSQSQLRLFGHLGFVMFCGILGILLWIIAALMDLGEPFLLSELLVTRAIVIKKKNMLVWALPPSEYLHRSVIRADRHRAVYGKSFFLRILKLLRLNVQPDHAKAAHDALAVVIGFAGLILWRSRSFKNKIMSRNLEAQVGAEANSLSRLGSFTCSIWRTRGRRAQDIAPRICKLNC